MDKSLKHKAKRFRSARAISALIVREMTTAYGRSPGGYFWMVAEPVAGIAVLTMLFSLISRSPPIGVNFPIFYATGLLTFMFYRDLEQKVSASLRFSKALLFYPSITYIDALIARLVLAAITQLLVFYIVMGFILAVWTTRTYIEPRFIISSLFATTVLAAGIGALNCVLISFFPIWERLWVVINRPLLLISGVIFIFDNVPTQLQGILWYNPVIHLVGQMRRGFYPSYRGEYIEIMYPIGVGLFLLFVGLILLNRFNRDILELT